MYIITINSEVKNKNVSTISTRLVRSYYRSNVCWKSEELIRRIRTLSYAKKSIVCFKPAIDDRYAKEEIASHAGNMWEAKAVKDVSEIKEFLKDKKYDIVGIDEVQFFLQK